MLEQISGNQENRLFLQAIRTAIVLAKGVESSVNENQYPAIHSQMKVLLNALSTAKKEAFKSINRVHELEKAMQSMSDAEFDSLFHEDDEAHPFCKICYDHVTPMEGTIASSDNWKCGACDIWAED